MPAVPALQLVAVSPPDGEVDCVCTEVTLPPSV